MPSSQFTVSWDPKYGLMMVEGPAGFTQFPTSRAQARALAETIGAEFYVSEPCTTRRPENVAA